MSKRELTRLEVIQRVNRKTLKQRAAALLGLSVRQVSAATICRLKEIWRLVFGRTRTQRCWKHKTANVLNRLPKGLQLKAKAQRYVRRFGPIESLTSHPSILWLTAAKRRIKRKQIEAHLHNKCQVVFDSHTAY